MYCNSFLLLLNPKFRDLTSTRIIIASVVAIAGDYLFEKVILQHESNDLTTLFLLILWCVAWGFINYDYQQRYNEGDVYPKILYRGAGSNKLVKNIENGNYFQIKSTGCKSQCKIVIIDWLLDKRKLDALPKSNYKKEKEQELSKLRMASCSSGRSYGYYRERERRFQQELRAADEEMMESERRNTQRNNRYVNNRSRFSCR